MQVEKKARGGAVADVRPEDDEVSVMFAAACAVRTPWSSDDDSKYLAIDYGEFVWDEIKRAYDEGRWSPYSSEQSGVCKLLPAQDEDAQFRYRCSTSSL